MTELLNFFVIIEALTCSKMLIANIITYLSVFPSSTSYSLPFSIINILSENGTHLNDIQVRVFR